MQRGTFMKMMTVLSKPNQPKVNNVVFYGWQITLNSPRRLCTVTLCCELNEQGLNLSQILLAN